MAGYLYTLGLSLRDLQEALYFLLGSVLSGTAVNQVTIRVQERMNKQQQEAITATPPILIVDGVWVSIQYTLDSFKLDRAGHQRQCRQAQERVILVAIAVWPDGAYHILDFAIAATEDQQVQAFKQKWQPLEPKAVHAFLWGIKRTFTFYEFGKELPVHIRTTNHVERFFREFRAKAHEVGAFPNEASCLTLFFMVMLRDPAKHDRLSMAKT